MGGLLVQSPPVHLDHIHHPGPQGVAQLPAHHLKQNGYPGDLQAACGAACAAAHEHQPQQQHLAQGRPHGEVRRDKARGADNRGHLEGRLAQGVGEGAIQRHDFRRDHRHRHQYDGQIRLELCVAENIPHPPQEDQVKEVEVNGKEEHEHRQHPLDIGAEVGGAGIVCAEAAGTGGAQSVYHAVKQAHAAQKQENDLQRRQGRVDNVESAGGVLGFGHQLIHCGPGHLRLENVDGAVRGVHQHHHEHQYAHAADPVGKAAPKQHAPAQRLHIRQYRGPGGGKAADRLEKGVDIGGDLLRKHKRQRPDGGQHDPGQSHDHKSVLNGAGPPSAPAQQAQQGAGDRSQHNGEGKAEGASLPIQQRHRHGQHQKRRLYQHHAAQGK